MKITCTRCLTKNEPSAAYCGRCSHALSLVDPSERRWRIGFFVLCGVVFSGLVWLAIKDVWPWQFDPRVLNILGLVASAIVGVAVVIGAACLYFLPTIIANRRHHHNAVPIFLVNLVFGITFLGWFIALIWSVTAINDRLKKL